MLSSAAAFFLIATSPAAEPAANAPPPAAAAAPGAAAPSDKAGAQIRCKSYRPSGTRFDKRVCFTVAEWERRREEGREAAQQIQNRPQISIERGN